MFTLFPGPLSFLHFEFSLEGRSRIADGRQGDPARPGSHVPRNAIMRGASGNRESGLLLDSSSPLEPQCTDRTLSVVSVQ